MKWSWRIGTFAGISVYMHATFLLLIGWIALQNRQSVQAMVTSVAFILALFLCVVLHEYGHALTARRYGIKTKDITLLPIGGIARLERMPDDPTQELWVAIAGPAVNVVIAALIAAWLFLTGQFQNLTESTLMAGGFLGRLMMVNVFLVAFNLLPAFPMDGGRVLRALLSRRMEYTKATQTAASIGQGMALLFGFAGIFGNPFLVFIALFVWIGAAQEAAMVQMKSALEGIPVSRAMITDFRALPADARLSDAINLILRGSQLDFPVLEGDRPVGILTRAKLLRGISERGPEAPVRDFVCPDFEVVQAGEMLESSFRRMQQRECHTAPVLQHGRMVGLLTMDNVGEFVMIQSAMRRPMTTSERRPAAA